MGVLLMIKNINVYEEYATKIFNGTKHIELRKKSMGVKKNDLILIYEPKPYKQIRGGFVVDSVVCDTPNNLWNRYHQIMGVDKKFYSEYYDDVQTAWGFLISDIFLFTNRYSDEILDEISYIPPQGISYWNLPLSKDLELFCQEKNIKPNIKSIQLELF